MNDLEALRQRVADLEALLPRSEPPLQLRPARYEPTPPTTRTLDEIASSGPLSPLTIRQVRQLAVAVALGRGALTLPGNVVPADYAGDMERLAVARGEGLSWRAAFARRGLEIPDDAEVREQARSLRRELRGLWDGVLPVLNELERRVPGTEHRRIIDSLRGLLV